MKGERVAQLELLLHSHPEGLRRAEIARRLGVHRSTISRYVDELSQYADVYAENNLIKIRNNLDNENISLSVYESLAFNLSAEKLAQTTEFQNPHLASGLRKIAMNMRSYAPKISENIIYLAETIDMQAKKSIKSDNFNSILEVLIDSWVSGRIVKIKVRKTDEEVEEVELAPYFIGFKEGDSGRSPISVTGRLRHTTDIQTIDISRIIAAEILDETYTIPDNLKPFKKNDSHIDIPDIDTIDLKVEIKEMSAMNVFSSLSHTPFRYEKGENGLTICTFSVENSIELVLKIIQSGTDIRILSPVSFRNRFCNYLDKILKLYR